MGKRATIGQAMNGYAAIVKLREGAIKRGDNTGFIDKMLSAMEKDYAQGKYRPGLNERAEKDISKIIKDNKELTNKVLNYGN